MSCDGFTVCCLSPTFCIHELSWMGVADLIIIWARCGRQTQGLTCLVSEHHLYILISQYLQAHPTTEDTPFRAGMRIAGMPLPQKPVAPPAKPRGWKMNDILPLHSPAMSGGGVSENIFKDMMQEMQGGQPGMVEGLMAGGGSDKEGKKKKDKKKIKG